MDTRITRVFREDGKVTIIHCGAWPDITAYERVEVDGERYFRLAHYGEHKLYRPNQRTRRMEYVRSI